MTLTILNVAYSLGTVGDAVGGAEQILSAIDRALVEAGATSIVIACEGSRAYGTLVETPAPGAVFDDAARSAAHAAHIRAIATVLDEHPVDVVHLHGIDFHAYLPAAGVPALATLHLPPSWYPAHALIPSRPDTFVHCVSESQRRSCPSSPALLATIPNGVTIPTHEPVRGGRRGVVALGRICPEKGFHLALAAARRAGVPMTLAGRVFPYPTHVEYWAREIAPQLDDERRFIGAVDAERRTELLAHARCVLIPSLVAETSSLVAMEALAAGTPVVAFANGALTEIVEHGVTGFLVHDEEEMADAIEAAATLDPDACRAAAIARFSVGAMTRQYLERYETLAATATRSGGRVTPERAAATLTLRPQPAPLEISEICSTAELRALAPEWRSLANAATCTPFQRPEWLLPWWEHFGTDAPAAVALRRRGELVALAPLYVRPEARGERVLALIGTGNSDYVDVLAHPSHRRDAASALLAYIAETSTRWDRCELGPLPATSALLSAAAPCAWRSVVEQMDVCPVLPLGSGLDGAIPARFLSRLRYAWRRLTREHEICIESANAGNARSLLDALCDLHGERWRARGADGVLDSARVRAFHGAVVDAMVAQGQLRLDVMRVDGRTAAAFYGFADARCLYYYIGGFDPGFARYSVGSLIVLHAIEHAAQAGAREVDFLRGRESYKYRWGAGDRPVYGWRMMAADSAAADAA